MSTPRQAVDVRVTAGGRKKRRTLFYTHEVNILLPFSEPTRKRYNPIIGDCLKGWFHHYHPHRSKHYSVSAINAFLYVFYCYAALPGFPPLSLSEIISDLMKADSVNNLIEEMPAKYGVEVEKVCPNAVLDTKTFLILQERKETKKYKTTHHPKGIFFYHVST